MLVMVIVVTGAVVIVRVQMVLAKERCWMHKLTDEAPTALDEAAHDSSMACVVVIALIRTTNRYISPTGCCGLPAGVMMLTALTVGTTSLLLVAAIIIAGGIGSSICGSACINIRIVVVVVRETGDIV